MTRNAKTRNAMSLRHFDLPSTRTSLINATGWCKSMKQHVYLPNRPGDPM